MYTQLQGIESILKVFRIVNPRNKFITRLHSCIISVIFLDIRQDAYSFTKMNLLIGIFQVFWVQFRLVTVRAAIFKNTPFFQKTFNGCISYFSSSIIQKIIKLETAYFLHGRCHYSNI